MVTGINKFDEFISQISGPYDDNHSEKKGCFWCLTVKGNTTQ